jgi:hypothetical protein
VITVYCINNNIIKHIYFVDKPLLVDEELLDSFGRKEVVSPLVRNPLLLNLCRF